MRHILLTILTIFLLADGFAQTASSPQQDKPYISWGSVANNNYENIMNPTTFLDSTKVYSQSDTTSNILSVLKFNMPLKLESVGKNQQYHPIWYKISSGNTFGYIQSENVSTHTFATSEKGTGNSLYYFIKRDYSKKYNPNVGGFTIYKYDKNKNQFTDTLEIKSNEGDIIKEIVPLQEIQHGWKNVTMAIHAKQIHAYCGGGTADLFIVDANNKLSELLSIGWYADDGSAESQNSNVWLPIKFPTGKVLLVSNGDIENIFDSYSGGLNTIPFPKDLTIPKTELVVFKETETQSILDKNGEPLKNADDSYKSKTVKNITKYFRWDGTKLVQIK